MNPPYSGNLHLKILSKIISEYPNAEVVNLSPIRWLQDPLAEYKKYSDLFRFEDIREKIESIDIIDCIISSNLFGSLQAAVLGIYYVTKDG